jgi:surface protein
MTDNRERTTGLLPPDSRGLFHNGELQEHNFAESSFIEDDVGTSVSEFDLTNVDTSNVQDMSCMFLGAELFNQEIGGWDTSNIQDMNNMFGEAESFDQDIGRWDTSNVESMNGMFLNAQSFDQDISAWCVEQITQKPPLFDSGAGFEGINAKQPNWGDTC